MDVKKEMKKWNEVWNEISNCSCGEQKNVHGEGAYEEIKKISGTTLDVGCGDLEYLDYVEKSEDVFLTGLDFSEVAIRLAMERTKDEGYVRLVLGTAQNIPFRKRIFDETLCIETMHYTGDEYKQVLEELSRVSKSRAIITLHHRDMVDGNTSFVEEEAIRLLEASNFKIDRMKIFRAGDMFVIPAYRPWPHYLPHPDTKGVMYIECMKE